MKHEAYVSKTAVRFIRAFGSYFSTDSLYVAVVGNPTTAVCIPSMLTGCICFFYYFSTIFPCLRCLEKKEAGMNTSYRSQNRLNATHTNQVPTFQQREHEDNWGFHAIHGTVSVGGEGGHAEYPPSIFFFLELYQVSISGN